MAEAKASNLPVAGLEEALANHRKTCNDEGLLSKATLKVEERKIKVSMVELEVKEAKASERADKIAQKELKLQEARINLKEAEADLAELQ